MALYYHIASIGSRHTLFEEGENVVVILLCYVSIYVMKNKMAFDITQSVAECRSNHVL